MSTRLEPPRGHAPGGDDLSCPRVGLDAFGQRVGRRTLPPCSVTRSVRLSSPHLRRAKGEKMRQKLVLGVVLALTATLATVAPAAASGPAPPGK